MRDDTKLVTFDPPLVTRRLAASACKNDIIARRDIDRSAGGAGGGEPIGKFYCRGSARDKKYQDGMEPVTRRRSFAQQAI